MQVLNLSGSYPVKPYTALLGALSLDNWLYTKWPLRLSCKAKDYLTIKFILVILGLFTFDEYIRKTFFLFLNKITGYWPTNYPWDVYII